MYNVFYTGSLAMPMITYDSTLGGYNRTSRPAARQAKIYLARPLPAAVLRLDWLQV